MTDPFAGFRPEEKIDNEAFQKLNSLTEALLSAEQAVLDAQEALKQAQEVHRDIEQFQLPKYMGELGLKDFTTTSGLKIVVDRKIRASIGSRKAAAFAWLIDNGHAGLIKNVLSVAFNRDQTEEAEQLQKELQGRFAGTKRDMKVEAATITSFVKDQLENGVDIPADIFGIIEQEFAKVKRPKKK